MVIQGGGVKGARWGAADGRIPQGWGCHVKDIDGHTHKRTHSSAVMVAIAVKRSEEVKAPRCRESSW
jgi:hypothetical protein